MKLNLGAGGDLIPGWRNMDIMFAGDDYIDITRSLPFPDNSAEFIVCGHCLEHITAPDAFRFFGECCRVLKPGGVLRVAVPSIERVFRHGDSEYLAWLGSSGFGEATMPSAIKNLVVNHTHLMIWTVPTLELCMWAAGFGATEPCEVGSSRYPELRGVEGHGKVIGEHNNWIETIVVEATK